MTVPLLEPFAAGVWLRSLPGYRIGPFTLGARMTVLALAGGGLALVSPVGLDDAAVRELRALGEVRAIVAPSKWHYKFVPRAKALFPAARVLGAPGLRVKRPALPIEAELSDGGHELDAGVEQKLVGGMPALGEIVLLHRASRTLVVTDLFFHQRQNPSAFTRWYLRRSGALGRPAQTLLLRWMTKDRAALAATRDALLAWDFDGLVLAHGDCLAHGGRDALRSALAWVG